MAATIVDWHIKAHVHAVEIMLHAEKCKLNGM